MSHLAHIWGPISCSANTTHGQWLPIRRIHIFLLSIRAILRCIVNTLIFTYLLFSHYELHAPIRSDMSAEDFMWFYANLHNPTSTYELYTRTSIGKSNLTRAFLNGYYIYTCVFHVRSIQRLFLNWSIVHYQNYILRCINELKYTTLILSCALSA